MKDKAKEAWQKKRAAAKAAKDKAAGLVAALTGQAPVVQSGDNTEDEDWSESEEENGMFGCAFNDRLRGRSWRDVLAGDVSDSDAEESDGPDLHFDAAHNHLRVGDYDPVKAQTHVPRELIPKFDDVRGPREGTYVRHLSQNNDEVVQALSNFAHSVKSRHQSQSARRKQARLDRCAGEAHQPVIIQSEADLDAAQDIIQALPRDERSLRKIAKQRPHREHLKKGEVWVMADSGSTLHAIDVKKELPEYAHLVRPSKKHRGRSAETACGGKVTIDGELELSGLIGNDDHTITFNDMKVSMPICSLRKIVKAGNILHIDEVGGYIFNPRTKQKIELHERAGVYFFKFRLHDPVDQLQKPKSSFHRPA